MGLYLDNSGNPLGLTVEAGDQSGSYFASVVLPLDFYGKLRWDVPIGGTAPSISQGISPNTNAGPLLSDIDLAGIQTATALALQTTGLIGPDITSLEDAMATPDGRARFVFYMLTNSSQDAAGNVIVRNQSGAVIANLASHQVNTLLQTMVGGVFSVMPGTQ